MRARHGLRSGIGAVVVSRKRGKTASRIGVVAVRVGAVGVSAGETQMMRRERIFPLDLRGSSGEEVDVHGVVKASWAEIAAHVARQIGTRVTCVCTGIGVRRRNIGRRKLRRRCRVRHALRRRRHHVVHLLERNLVLSGVEHTSLGGGSGGGGGGGVLLVAAPRVGVVVDARVARQFVGAAEALCAARELAGVRLLARVGADVTGLVLEAVESLVAKGTLVRARQVRTHVLLGRGLGGLFLGRHLRRHGGHGGSGGGHGRVRLDTGVDVGRGGAGVRRGRGRRVVWI